MCNLISSIFLTSAKKKKNRESWRADRHDNVERTDTEKLIKTCVWGWDKTSIF